MRHESWVTVFFHALVAVLALSLIWIAIVLPAIQGMLKLLGW